MKEKIITVTGAIACALTSDLQAQNGDTSAAVLFGVAACIFMLSFAVKTFGLQGRRK